ncbi:Winged helix-turn helix [Photorhabdus luminescens]|uniref:Winged helix-turn helix n=1 Tax=Photorhabdus luminescens TaxID=29488 RepID=A0A1G5QSX3_PHOLU|nr:Winged helix-turn helix [Photorhabdus luminescens]
MNKWLHHNGFSYKKPTSVLHKFNAEQQRAFMEAYGKLKQEAGDHEPILFIDGVHPTQGTKLAYGLDAKRPENRRKNNGQPYPSEPDGRPEFGRYQ